MGPSFCGVSADRRPSPIWSSLSLTRKFQHPVGWYGFNAGSALLLGIDNSGGVGALAAANTSIGAGAGGMGALLSYWLYYYVKLGESRLDLPSFMNGVLSGLVGITAGCGTIELWAAAIIGFVAGMMFHLGKYALELLCIDDAVDAVPVHLFSGIWGMIAVGLFSTPKLVGLAFGSTEYHGLFYGDWRLFVNQLVAIGSIFMWSSLTTIPFFVALSRAGMLRTLGLEEVVGLDVKYHGENPDADNEIHDEIRSFKTELDRSRRGKSAEAAPDE